MPIEIPNQSALGVLGLKMTEVSDPDVDQETCTMFFVVKWLLVIATLIATGPQDHQPTASLRASLSTTGIQQSSKTETCHRGDTMKWW